MDHVDEIGKCWEEFGKGSAEVVACCKEQSVPEECFKYCGENDLAKLLQEKIDKCWEEFGSGNGSAEVVECCKEQGVTEMFIKYCEEK